MSSTQGEATSPEPPHNPFVAPAADLTPGHTPVELAAIADDIVLDIYQGRAALIRFLAFSGVFIGGLVGALGAFALLAAIVLYVIALKDSKPSDDLISVGIVGLFAFVLGTFLFVVSRGVARFRPWARYGMIAFMVFQIAVGLLVMFMLLITLTLIGIPIVLVMMGVPTALLALLVAPGTAIVFSESYQRSRARRVQSGGGTDAARAPGGSQDMGRVVRWLIVCVVALIVGVIVVVGLMLAPARF
jgi:hypothetical protein